MTQIKVLYIAGPSRSGSTFLSSILGEVPGIFNAGEVIDLWDRGFLHDGLCSCGLSFSQCGVWADVINEVFKKTDNCNARGMMHIRDLTARSWLIPIYLALPGQRERMRRRLQPFLFNLAELYRCIMVRTGSRVVVDSSKNVGYAYLLSLMPSIELYCVHLIRDSRATVYSWRRRKAGLWQQPPGKTTLSWISRNITAGLLADRMKNRCERLRYEDFVKSPRATVNRVLSLIREEPQSLPFVTDAEVELHRQHSVYGNPDRFGTGRITVRLDDEWRREIKTSDYVLVTALSWPLLIRYGYPILSRDSSRIF